MQSKLSTLNTVIWSTDFTPNPGGAEVEFGAAGGSASTAISQTLDGGVLVSSSGATGSSAQICRSKNSTASPKNYQAANMKTSVWAIATRAKVVAVNATCDLYMCAMSDETIRTVNLGIHGATSQTNWTYNGAAIVDLGVAFTANVYADLMMIANGTTVQCYIGNGTGGSYSAVGSPQDQTGFPTNPGHLIFEATNGATASNVALHIDKAMAINTSPS